MNNKNRITEFVGRDVDLHYLINAWKKAKAGQPQLEVILADSGMGKTRLIQEFYHWLSQNEDTRDYWPVHLSSDGNPLDINPNQCTDNGKGDIPWLWWGMRWHDTLMYSNSISTLTYFVCFTHKL